MPTPTLAAAQRYLVLHEQYLIQAPPQAEFDEYKALNLRFALRGLSVGSVKAYIRKEQEQCTISAPAQ